MSNELKKSLGFSAALSTVVGIVIGSGVFFKASEVFTATGAPGLSLLAWIVAGLITIAAGLTCAELAAAIPKTGGMVIYLKEIYGDTVGFLTGWMLSIVYYPGLIAALGTIFAQNVVSLLGLNSTIIPAIAIATIVLLAFLNTLGSKTGGLIQTVSTICKLVPLALIIIFGILKGDGGSANLTPMTNPDINAATGFGTALLAVLFAYEGWLSAANLAGEMKNPKKDLPKALSLGLIAVMGVYVLINVAYLWVLPADQLAASSTPASDVASKIFGSTGGNFITIGILISVFGTLNALIFTGPRTLYVLGKEKQLPMSDFIAKVSDNGVSANAIWITSGIGCLFALTGSWGLLSSVPTFTVWVFYIMTFFGVIKLRKTKPDMERPFLVPLYPILPIIAIIGGLYAVISTIFAQTSYALIGLALTAIGLPIYMSTKNKNNS
ncbi:MAG: amino acid permease [Peptostreptococcaceae bacterium]